jgi:hypothetical protein
MTGYAWRPAESEAVAEILGAQEREPSAAMKEMKRGGLLTFVQRETTINFRVNWIYATTTFTLWRNAIIKTQVGNMPLQLLYTSTYAILVVTRQLRFIQYMYSNVYFFFYHSTSTTNFQQLILVIQEPKNSKIFKLWSKFLRKIR